MEQIYRGRVKYLALFLSDFDQHASLLKILKVVDFWLYHAVPENSQKCGLDEELNKKITRVILSTRRCSKENGYM